MSKYYLDGISNGMRALLNRSFSLRAHPRFDHRNFDYRQRTSICEFRSKHKPGQRHLLLTRLSDLRIGQRPGVSKSTMTSRTGDAITIQRGCLKFTSNNNQYNLATSNKVSMSKYYLDSTNNGIDALLNRHF